MTQKQGAAFSVHPKGEVKGREGAFDSTKSGQIVWLENSQVFVFFLFKSEQFVIDVLFWAWFDAQMSQICIEYICIIKPFQVKHFVIYLKVILLFV